jgi:hypothetical protein
MISLHSVAEVFAPWQAAYGHSKVISISVTAVHLLAVLFGGGFAVAADRATLRAVRAGEEVHRRRALDDIGAVHRPVIMALSISFISGILLLTADLETFAVSPVYWLKMSLVVLLLANGYVLRSTERAAQQRYAASAAPEPSHWGRLRATAWVSMVLWAAVVVAGTTLVSTS